MAFADTTTLRIAAAFDWPIHSFETSTLINGSLTRVFNDAEQAATGGGAQIVSIVEGYLDNIESYDTQLNTGAGNAGLIKADVLAWDSGGGRLQGLREERERYVQRLARLLGLDSGTSRMAPTVGLNSGKGRLVRS